MVLFCTALFGSATHTHTPSVSPRSLTPLSLSINRYVIETYCFAFSSTSSIYFYNYGSSTPRCWCWCTFLIAFRIAIQLAHVWSCLREEEKEVVKWKCCTLYVNFVRSWTKMWIAHAAAVAPFFALDSFPFCLNKFFIIMKMMCDGNDEDGIFDLLHLTHIKMGTQQHNLFCAKFILYIVTICIITSCEKCVIYVRVNAQMCKHWMNFIKTKNR